MALPDLPPQPLLTDMLEAPTGTSMGQKIHRVWIQWFNAVVDRLQMAPMIVTTTASKSVTVALSGVTLLPAAKNKQTGLYRISYHNDLNTAGGKSQLVVTYVCDGVSRTLTGVQVSSTTDPAYGVMVFDPDVNTDVTYGTTCVIPGGGISYNLDITLERLT